MTDQKSYVVVLRARSTARFKSEEGVEVVLGAVPGSTSPVRFRIRTRWVDEGHDAPTPRELWIEGRGPAPSLDEAASKFAAAGRFFSTILSFAANTPVGIPEVDIAYDASAGSTEREFLQVFVPDERGHPSEGRIARTDEFNTVFERLNGSGESSRLHRAIQQYGIALRYWYLGGEWLALSHLYMAVETLTKSVVRRCCEDDGAGEEEFARRKGIDTSHSRWRSALEGWCRKNIVFDGDNATYVAAKAASDGVEHGFLELGEVYTNALIATEATFGHVRRTILRLLNVPPTEFPDLYQRAPRDVSSIRKMVRGHFLGDGSEPAPEGEEYPRLEWRSSVQNVRPEDDTLTLSFREKFTVHCSPTYGFKGLRFEVRGRAEEGRDPINLNAVTEISEAGPSTAGPPAEALQLMRRAHAFASAAVGHGSSVGVPPFMLNVFELISEQVSLFEAIEVLLRDNRPVEAIVLLRSLILGTCRLQCIAQHSNPEGIALRIKLDAMDRHAVLYASDADVVRRVRDESMRWQAKAAERGVAIPEDSPDLGDTGFYAAHGHSLRFAEEVALADTLAAALHTVKADPDDRRLYTRVVDAGQLRGVAGVATAALTDSAVALCKALNWPWDESLAGTIKGEAERMAEND